MAEIQLNKPLYGDGGGGQTPPKDQPTAPAPRPARAALWMRVAAVAIDLLLLHGVATLALKLFFDPVVALGIFGPYLGLTVALLYFTFGYGSLTHGRTVGKLVMRLQVADLKGGFDLSMLQAFLRALLMIWPLWILAAVGMQVEEMLRPQVVKDATPIVLQMGAFAVILAWYFGNFFHAWVDPHGCSWVDRLVRSVEFSSDALVEDVQVFLRTARERAEPARIRRAFLVLMACLVSILALAGALTYRLVVAFRTMPAETLELKERELQTFFIPGFIAPFPTELEDEGSRPEDSATTASRGIQHKYRRRGPITAEEVKGNPAAMGALDRATSYTLGKFQEYMTSGSLPAGVEPPPEQVKVQVGFAPYGDLFFASRSPNIYSESRVLNLEEVRRGFQTTASAEAVTTATAAAAETSDSLAQTTPSLATEATTEPR